MKKPISIILVGLYLIITGVMIIIPFCGMWQESSIFYYYGFLIFFRIIIGIVILTGNLAGRILLFINFIFFHGLNLLLLIYILNYDAGSDIGMFISTILIFMMLIDSGIILTLYINDNVKKYYKYWREIH